MSDLGTIGHAAQEIEVTLCRRPYSTMEDGGVRLGLDTGEYPDGGEVVEMTPEVAHWLIEQLTIAVEIAESQGSL